MSQTNKIKRNVVIYVAGVLSLSAIGGVALSVDLLHHLYRNRIPDFPANLRGRGDCGGNRVWAASTRQRYGVDGRRDARHRQRVCVGDPAE